MKDPSGVIGLYVGGARSSNSRFPRWACSHTVRQRVMQQLDSPFEYASQGVQVTAAEPLDEFSCSFTRLQFQVSMARATEAPRFICDRMLERLGRYLRAAGYDTEIVVSEETDRKIVCRTKSENRILLTCDRKLSERPDLDKSAVLLPSNGLGAAARELGRRIRIDWLRAPFSRCLIDNTPVVAAEHQDRTRLPTRARSLGGEITICPRCDRLYWTGSHVRRMENRLREWHGERTVPQGSGPTSQV